jgi:hypothetical protein
MSSDDRQIPAPPVVTVAPVETAATPVSASGVLTLVDTTPPVAEPEMLAQALRDLQQRIPEFTQLSVKESGRMRVRGISIRSSSRAASTRRSCGGTPG